MRLYEIKQNISNVAAYRYLIELSILNEIEKSKLEWISEQSSDREESIKKRSQNPESLRSSKVEFRAKEIARNQESEKIVDGKPRSKDKEGREKKSKSENKEDHNQETEIRKQKRSKGRLYMNNNVLSYNR